MRTLPLYGALSWMGLLLLISGCASPEARLAKGIDPPGVDLDLLEATFRYQFTHNESGNNGHAALFCIGYGEDLLPGDNQPSPEMLRRLSDVTPHVGAIWQCKDRGRGLKSKESGELAMQFTLGEVTCMTADRCEVHGGYYEASQSASGHIYLLEKHDGRWSVVKDQLNGIS